MRVYTVSLGCPKNQVDSEFFLGYLLSKGFKITKSFKDTDFYIINTCGFIHPAKKEAIEEILKAIDLKRKYNFLLGVLGCFYKRYKNILIKEFPEVDFFIDTASPSLDYTDVVYRFGKYSKSFPKFLKLLTILKNFKKRSSIKYKIFFEPHIAYIKISDGCSNRCNYCAIPLIKGNFVFYDLNFIKTYLKRAEEKGIKEIYICAQDTTAHPKLLKILELVSNFKFERKKLLYIYPNKLKKEILITLKELNFDPYLEIPLQHVSDKVLKNMGRKYTKKDILKLFENIKTYFPEAHIRSTFILGHPGENEKTLEELKSFLKEFKLTWVGFFPYYKEEGTKSFYMTTKYSFKERQKLVEDFYEFQSYITSSILEKYERQKEKVIIDFEIQDKAIKLDLANYFKKFNIDDAYLYQARLPFESYNLDGIVYLFSKVPLKPGFTVEVTLDKFLPPYDFVALL